MWQANDNRWLIFFSVFLSIVVGLLLFLHLANAEDVPKERSWDNRKALYLCDAPAWVGEHLEEALVIVEPWAQYTKINLSNCGTSGPMCDYSITEKSDLSIPREASCVDGAILLTLADQKFKDGHGDETLISDKDGTILRVTVLFPSELESPKIGSLVLAHALMHAEGYGHVETSLGALIAEPTGHLMSRSASKLGARVDGL